MNKRWLYLLIIILILLFVVSYIFIKLSEKKEEKFVNNESMNNSEIANPASVYCKENNGTLEIRNNEDGSQYGVCKKNGKECEEWKYFRGECKLE